MITIAKVEKSNIFINNKPMIVEIRGLSTDEKPIKINNREIENGSVFIEIDTGKISLYDITSKEWKEI